MGNPDLYASTSNYTFAAQTTQTANNSGQTVADLQNTLVNSLTAGGYKN